MSCQKTYIEHTPCTGHHGHCMKRTKVECDNGRSQPKVFVIYVVVSSLGRQCSIFIDWIWQKHFCRMNALWLIFCNSLADFMSCHVKGYIPFLILADFFPFGSLKQSCRILGSLLPLGIIERGRVTHFPIFPPFFPCSSCLYRALWSC